MSVLTLRRLCLACLLGASAMASAQSLEPTPNSVGTAALERGHFSTALNAWLKAANQGDAKAQNNMGYMYERGLGVPQSYSKALHWYRMAAAQGLAQAQFNIGTLYYYGYGVETNPREAVVWFRQAATQKLPEGEYMLGLAYVQGTGVPKSLTEGLMWLVRAATQGSLSGQLMAGQTYLSLSKPDPFKAYVWADIATSRGNADASLVRDYASFKMERDAIEKAAAAAKACLSSNYAQCPEY